MAIEWLGLNEIAGSANFTFVAFIGYVLLGVIGIRFGLYAYWNGRANDVETQVALWGYLILIGLTATLAGLVGTLRIVLTVFGRPLLDLAGSLVLVLVLCLTLALRAVYASTASTATGRQPPDDHVLVTLLVGAVAVSTIGIVVLGDVGTLFAGAQGVIGTALLLYGYRFGSRQLANTRVQGTLLDTLLRHLLPVLLFGSMIPILELVVVAGLDQAIVLHVQIVFVIMTATTLMTATIKLRQNLVGMRG